MGRGIANTGTIKLSDIKKAYSNSTSAIQTDTFTTPGSSSVTAPASATWVEIECWGAGGGGRGYNSLGAEYGGGGGAYWKLKIPVVGGVTSFDYTVGTGGAGGASGANGNVGGFSSVSNIYDFSSISASGGRGGATTIGGISGTSIGGSTNDLLGLHVSNSLTIAGANANTSAGGTGANGGAGGTTNGAAGTAPGGGGAPGTTSGTAGGNGANGQVRFTWYGVGSVNNLRSFLRGGSYNTNQGSVGYSGIIPASGTIRIRDFVGADGIGFNANTLRTNTTNVRFVFSSEINTGGYTEANARLRVLDTGILTGNSFSALDKGQRWMERLSSNTDSTLASNFDVQLIKTLGTTPSGNSVNTWIQCSSNVEWFIYTDQNGNGSNTKGCNGFLTFRRRNDNTVLVNVAINLYSESIVTTDPCPSCCFTPETLITMADYTTKAIAEVRIGEHILVRGGSRAVTGIIVVENRPMFIVRFADGRFINTSEDHPFYVVNKGYASIKPDPSVKYKDLGIPEQLIVGDFVLDQNGNENEIVSISDLYYPHAVYTFTESEFYANGMLVY